MRRWERIFDILELRDIGEIPVLRFEVLCGFIRARCESCLCMCVPQICDDLCRARRP